MASETGRSALHGDGEGIVCHFCGYELDHLDWVRAEYKCPECGQVNIPGDANVGPFLPRPWPGVVKTAVIVLWPGLVLGGTVVMTSLMSSEWMLAIMLIAGTVGVIGCVSWPWAAAEILLYKRVPDNRRLRMKLLVAIGGMVCNVAVVLVAARIAVGLSR